jgi:hypothetical protein
MGLLSRVFEHETYVNRLRARMKFGHVFEVDTIYEEGARDL